MEHWITNLKAVVVVILISEFLKELLIGETFRKYIQFAVSLFLFGFFLTSFFHTDFSLPSFPEEITVTNEENLLIQQYETQIAAEIGARLSNEGVSYSEILVRLSPQYEIESITIKSCEPPETIDAVLKGEFPYEVVPKTEESHKNS